jgi:hypothetical protein
MVDEGRVARDGAVVRSRAAVSVSVALEGTHGLTVGKPGIQRTGRVPANPLEGLLVRGPGGGSDACCSRDGVGVSGLGCPSQGRPQPPSRGCRMWL